jgi:hypothetical protein
MFLLIADLLLRFLICVGTPLCRHIREVIQEVKLYESTLRAHGQKACIIIGDDLNNPSTHLALFLCYL